MKKMVLLTYLIVIAALFKCSGAGSGDISTGFKEIDFNTTYTWSDTKVYSFADASISESCSGNECAAVVYRGTLNGKNYTGIGVNDRHNAIPDFFLKIYKTDSETEYTVKINKGGTPEETTTAQANITIVSGTPSAGYSRVTFNANISTASFTIQNGETIDAIEHP